MSCKYPKISNSYMFCFGCKDKNICETYMSNFNDIDMDMPTADEAFQMSEQIIKDCLTEELKEIKKKILNAIKNGDFSINGNGFLQQSTINRLIEMKYKVTTLCDRYEPTWFISWGKEK